MNQSWVYMCSPILTLPQSAPALSTLSHALNLDWRSISHMIIYVFQCYSFKSPHPHLVPQSQKVCYLHLCLFCCLAYRVIVNIFLNSMLLLLLSRFSRVRLCVTPFWTPSHRPLHPIPLGCSSAPALSAQLHASNLDWWSISHMIIYMFQCYSLKSSYPCLLPQCPKVCSLYLCLFCCLAYSVIIQFSLVQSLSWVQHFAIPWTAACQSSLAFTISWSLLKLMSTESVMPSNHLIFCHPLLLPLSIFPSSLE